MLDRVGRRSPFGKKLIDNDNVKQIIGKSRIEIDQARLLVLNAAKMIDEVGAKRAKNEIASIKVAIPKMTLKVIDRAIQIFGGAGVSSDTILAQAYIAARTIKIADGPSEVHL